MQLKLLIEFGLFLALFKKDLFIETFGNMQRVKQIIHRATDTPKKKRIGVVILSIFLLLIGGGIFYWHTHKKSIIKGELESAIGKKTKGLYVLGYDKFELDEVGGSLLVTNVRLNYDSNVYKQLLETDDAPAILANIFIPSLNITGVETPKAVIDKEVKGDRLQILDAKIEIIYTRKGKDSIVNVPPEQLYRQLLGNLNLIRVNQVDIRNAQLWTKRLGRKDTALKVDNVFLTLHDLRIDDTASVDTTRYFFSKNFALSATKIAWRNERKPYRYQVDNISLNSVDKTIGIGKIVVDPTLGEDAFMKWAKTQVDRFDIMFDSIRLVNVDFGNLFKETIDVDTMHISAATIKVYKDHNQPRDGVNRVGTFPHQELLKLPVSINIRKVYAHHAYIEYKQNTPKTEMKGKVPFNNVRLAIDNLTNQPNAIKANKICRADAQALFLNTALLKATFYFNLASENGAFSIDGHLGGFNAEKLNTITQPLTAAKIEKGTIRGADMKISGSDYVGHATITLLYDDLKIAVLEKNDEENKLEKKKLVSLAANIIVKNANPGIDNEVRTTSGTYQRDTNRAFFNLVWKSLNVAISETMGAPAKTSPAEEEKKRKKQEAKEERKEERKEKRKEKKEAKAQKANS